MSYTKPFEGNSETKSGKMRLEGKQKSQVILSARRTVHRPEVILGISDIKYTQGTKMNNLKHSEELYLYH